MGKVESWTDIDYAQAAIDMLPGTVEEIGEFLVAQRIPNKRVTGWTDRAQECPVALWLEKWTGTPMRVGFWKWRLAKGHQFYDLPVVVANYIVRADKEAS